MKITLIPKELIEERIAEARKTADDAGAALEAIKKQQADLSWQAKAKETEKRTAERVIGVLMAASVLNEGAPANIVELKNKILVTTAQSLRDDILVIERTRLLAEIPILEAELQKQCAHPFVVQTRYPYAGSPAYEYENQHKGTRVCAVCNFSEDSVSHREDKYKILADVPGRVVMWGTHLEKTPLVKRTSDGWYSVNAQLSLGEIIDCFTDQQIIQLLS